MKRRNQAIICMVALACMRLVSFGGPAGLEFRRITERGIARKGVPIPARGVRVFVYEGAPLSVRVTDKYIAVDYSERSGVLFDRAGGKFVRRFTVADGWPKVRHEAFAPFRRPREKSKMVGPGVLDSYHQVRPSASERYRRTGPRDQEPQYAVAASVKFGGRKWKAMQPAGFLRTLPRRVGRDYKKMRQTFGSWTGILRVLNAESFLQAEFLSVGKPQRYTTAEGLASNIVTHLAVADKTLWAACVDIYDPEKKQWGPGGLCRFDPKTGRWRRIEKIAGLPVRWVTLLESVGDDLWVGFREGSGIAGDKVGYGMGLYPGCYRPKATAIVLARLSGGKWTTFSRKPLPGGDRTGKAPTESPRNLALLGEKVFLFSETYARSSGNWQVSMDGHISLLDLSGGKWRTFDLEKDLAVFRLLHMVAEKGEIVALSDRGAHRWSARQGKWVFLDPKSPLVNPNLSAAVVVGDELWVGYTNQSFGAIGRQGISRFNEKTGKWAYTSPKEIGTACPVRTIAVMPDGDVRVLFRKRQWHGSAMPYSFYPRQQWNAPAGLGRFTKGKWQFPVKLAGVPASRKRERKKPDGKIDHWEEKLPIRHLAVAGEKLFVATAAGVYVGPAKWKRIAEGPAQTGWRPALTIRPSKDGKTLGIWRQDTHSKWQHGLYDPETDKVVFKNLPAGSFDPWRLYSHDYLLHWSGDASWIQHWVLVPTVKEGRWTIGKLGTRYHKVIETPHAVWIASRGELIRLDRKHLSDWLGKDKQRE